MEKRDYEGALYYLMTETAQLNGGKIVPLSQSAIDDLQELVKRNEPMRPIYEKDGTRSCPCCKGNWLTPNFKFCSDCGQKLDWSDE